ncbi:MAG: TIGR02147 family protein [Bdellovibrio sp.]|nr:TIGR02147 family protein [Bdellovibrio sp.]
MYNIFMESEYRKIIKTIVETKKQVDKKFNYQKMAESMGIQKAYLSQVLQGTRDFSQDQLYRAAQFLRLTEPEYEYMKLLLEYSRSALAERKQKLQKEISEIQSQNLKTEKSVDLKKIEVIAEKGATYYLDPLNQIVHMALDIPRFRKNISDLAKALELSDVRVKKTLSTLQEIGIIEIKNNEIKVLTHNIHLPKDSPIFWPWKTALSAMSNYRIRNLEENSTYNFSVVFAADEETKTKLQAMFLNFLKDARPLVEKAKSKEVFQMNFDLFSWTAH